MRTSINGITIAFDDTGSGMPLVLIHGFPLVRRMWRPQIEALVAAGFRVITPDLRGFGESDIPEGPYSMELFADDLVALLDSLGIEQAVIGGMSMGGYVLLNLLERYPKRVRAACFIVTRAGADDAQGKERRLQLAREVTRVGLHVVAEAFRPLLLTEETLAKRPNLVAEVCGWVMAQSPTGIAGALLAMRERKDYTSVLPSFDLPCLAIGAQEDKAAPPDNARLIAESIPGCRLAVLPHAGHLANMESPGEFNAILLDFLRPIARAD